MVSFGAPENILFENAPHLGSNLIRPIISKITQNIKENGGHFLMNEKVTGIITKKGRVSGIQTNKQILSTKHIILATGHSSRDVYSWLNKNQVDMALKEFSVGVRVEHQKNILNSLQHSIYSDKLPASFYKLKYYDEEQKTQAYSFCMCPGGVVLPSSTEKNLMVTNGMSNSNYNSSFSNAAIVVAVKKNHLDEKDVFSGIRFQENIEKASFELSKKYSDGKSFPAMSVKEFMENKLSSTPLTKTSCPTKLFKANLRDIFPDFICQTLKKSLIHFNKKIPGFCQEGPILIAPETRTSSLITICRDEYLESTSHKGLYPCGEGAGFAGGITSAAVDGIKVAISLSQKNS